MQLKLIIKVVHKSTIPEEKQFKKDRKTTSRMNENTVLVHSMVDKLSNTSTDEIYSADQNSNKSDMDHSDCKKPFLELYANCCTIMHIRRTAIITMVF